MKVRNKLLREPPKKYFILNKPRGVISTRSDTSSRKTVLEFLPTKHRDVHPVGRLDADTTGLLVLTNDGELTNVLTHPRYGVPKTYAVTVTGYISEKNERLIASGVSLEDGKTAPAKIIKIKKRSKVTSLQIVLKEGKKRQIRRMFKTLGYPVVELNRIAIGKLALGSMPVGSVCRLDEKEIAMLKKRK